MVSLNRLRFVPEFTFSGRILKNSCIPNSPEFIYKTHFLFTRHIQNNLELWANSWWIPFSKFISLKFKTKLIMTDLKRRTLFLTTGKQIRLFGNSMAIGKSLEVGEGSAPNIFSCISEPAIEKV